MRTSGNFIDGISTALPPGSLTQEEAASFLKRSYAGRLKPASLRLMEKIFANDSVLGRRFAFDAPEELVDEDPDRRMERFTRWSLALSAKAARGALARTGLCAEDISGLVVNTCTGYLCPGLSTYLIEELGLNRSVKAYDLAGAGCGGAVPNLQLANALAGETKGGAVLSVSSEICSCTFQMGDDASLIVSNALFGDGAAAAVVRGEPSGFELLASASRFAPEYRDDIRYVYRNGQLHNRLSARLPELAAGAAAAATAELLSSAGVNRGAVSRWAVHPGGEKVINAVRDLSLIHI